MNAAALVDLQDAWADAEPAHTAAELRMAGAFLAMAQRARLNASTQAQRADDAHTWAQVDRGPLPVSVNKAWARERASEAASARAKQAAPHRKVNRKRPACPTMQVIRDAAAAKGGPVVQGKRPEHQLAADLLVLGVIEFRAVDSLGVVPVRVAEVDPSGAVHPRPRKRWSWFAYYTPVNLESGQVRVSKPQVKRAAALLAQAGWGA